MDSEFFFFFVKFKENDFRILEFKEKYIYIYICIYIYIIEEINFFLWKLKKMILKFLKSEKEF